MTPGPTPPAVLQSGFYSITQPFIMGGVNVSQPVFNVVVRSVDRVELSLCISEPDSDDEVGVWGVVGGVVSLSGGMANLDALLDSIEVWLQAVRADLQPIYTGLVVADYSVVSDPSPIVYNF